MCLCVGGGGGGGGGGGVVVVVVVIVVGDMTKDVGSKASTDYLHEHSYLGRAVRLFLFLKKTKKHGVCDSCTKMVNQS